MNRFSKDIACIDTEITGVLSMFTGAIMATATILIVIVAITPSALVAVVPVGICCHFGSVLLGCLSLTILPVIHSLLHHQHSSMNPWQFIT